MADYELTSRFPDLKPIKGPPDLTTINFIGHVLHGRRDFDEETGTYVATRCFCIAFIPIFMIDAYRVADAENNSWYFLGRVPLSGFAKKWNLGVLLCLCLAIGWGGWLFYYNSNEKQAERHLAKADGLAQAGHLGAAAGEYRDLIVRNSPKAWQARERMTALMASAAQKAPGAEAVNLFRIAVTLHRELGVVGGVFAPSHVFDQGLVWVRAHTADDPRAALALLDIITPLAPKAEDLHAPRQAVLERLVAQHPHDAEFASELALVYEATGQWPQCERLLAPLQDRLKDTEGTRILGQILLKQGKPDQALALLEPYVQGRLPRLQAVERDFEQTLRRRQEFIAHQVDQRQAGDFPYRQWEHSNHAQRDQIVTEYVHKKLRDDAEVQAALAARAKEARVVPVALDLGIASLHKSQQLPDPAARKAELEKAEKHFLAISRYAGESDEFRLSFGQVCYWLGKTADGKKHFEQLLLAHQRKPQVLVAVSRVIRELGEEPEARKLMEEAYDKTTDLPEKQGIAAGRAVMAADERDRIIWLERADPRDPRTDGDLQTARGRLLLLEGKDLEAAVRFRAALAQYAKLTENASVLNNRALTLMCLFQATGESAVLGQIVETLDKALALEPRDSILLSNCGHVVLEAALRDLAGKDVDFSLLRSFAGLRLVGYFYGDEAGRERLAQRLREHPGIKRALSQYEKLMVLAPKRDTSYGVLLFFHTLTQDLPALERLIARMEAAGIDVSERRTQALEDYAGKRDAERKRELLAGIARGQEIMQTARQRKGVTLAVALTEQVQRKCSCAVLGEAVDPEEVVALATEAHAAAPSQATANALADALAFRLHTRLTARDKGYAQLAAQVRRSLTPHDTLCWALAHNPALRSALQEDADLKGLLDWHKERSQRFPNSPSVTAWALMRQFQPPVAAAWAARLRTDPLGALSRKLELQLSPYAAASVLHNYWALVLEGKEAEGLALLRHSAAQGVPLPTLPHDAGQGS